MAPCAAEAIATDTARDADAVSTIAAVAVAAVPAQAAFATNGRVLREGCAGNGNAGAGLVVHAAPATDAAAATGASSAADPGLTGWEVLGERPATTLAAIAAPRHVHQDRALREAQRPGLVEDAAALRVAPVRTRAAGAGDELAAGAQVAGPAIAW